MNFAEAVRVALEGIRSNKMRSFLTMLGVIIGVGAVIAMISLGEGAKQSVSAQIQGLGSNLLIVMPGRMFGGAGTASGARGSANVLKVAEVEAIKAGCPSVAEVAPETTRQYVVKWSDKTTTTSISGTSPEYPQVRNTQIARGKFFDARDVKQRARVAVLGPTVVEDLFGNVDPLGKSIMIGRMKFTVIGVTVAKGQSGFMDNDDRIFIPYSTAQRRLFGTDFFRTIYVEARDPDSMQQATEEISAVLTRRLGSSDSFTVRNQADILNTVQGTTQVFTLLLAGIASVSLLVGGIGIMNIMLVSVTERTREIGIRKAVGAKRRDILQQFLVESMVLSVLGGVVGILFGIGASALISKLGGWQTSVPTYSVVLSFGFSVAVGLFFGIYPAAKAARLDPIAALRYE
ncbi:MAG: ABC transporter permease [Bacillota bacterium]|nr:ABC transporter permease [Bacillota bacterium]